MSELFGQQILPHLPVLHAASLRIRRGEPLDGLLIPEELIAEGPGAISYAQAR